MLCEGIYRYIALLAGFQVCQALRFVQRRAELLESGHSAYSSKHWHVYGIGMVKIQLVGVR